MQNPRRLSFHDLDEDAVVRAILEGTATKTGEEFFAALVENLSKALDTQSAWVTEFIEKSRRLRALAFWADGELIPNFEIDVDGTPCEAVFHELNRFANGAKTKDDITLVIIKLQETSTGREDWEI